MRGAALAVKGGLKKLSLAGGASLAKARTMSRRETSRAERRSRRADSRAFSQPGSMWIRLQRPSNPSMPCLASQGLSLPSVRTFSCRALSASMRAVKSASFDDSWFTAVWRVRRSSSRAGTWLCRSCKRASDSADKASASASCSCKLCRRASSGAAKALRSNSKRSRRVSSWRDCSSTLRWSAASTPICCCT